MAGRCFGSICSEPAASRLPFFLVPVLPVFNQSRGHHIALGQIGHPPGHHSYRAFAQAAWSAYRERLPNLLNLAPPPLSLSDPQQGLVLKGVPERTDWWTRRVFDETLRQCVRDDGMDVAGLFGSNDTGEISENG